MTIGTEFITGSLVPPALLLITASFVIIRGLWWPSIRQTIIFSLLGLAYAFLANGLLFGQVKLHGGEISSFGGRYIIDDFSLGFNLVILLGTVLAILVSFDYLKRFNLTHLEYYPLILLSACGAMLMVAAADLIILVLALEIMSLAVYVLSAWRQEARESEEAGMKYFLLGAFASAFFIYGIALSYGATGTFTYEGILAAVNSEGFNQGALLSLGLGFVLVGLGFKAALVPFHQWAPDVYTGAPTSVTAFMSVVVKTAAFAALLRFAIMAFPNVSPALSQIFIVLVALTLIIANFLALEQKTLKRMLAYSAVAHAGYLGMGVLAGNESAVIWYLAAYTFMNIGAFAVLSLISNSNDKGDSLEEITGLGKHRPIMALAMSIFLLSLAGIPPFAGFFAKFLVFQATLEAGYIWLAVLGILASVVAVIYYMRFMIAMYSPSNTLPSKEDSKSPVAFLVIVVAAVATVVLGLLPIW